MTEGWYVYIAECKDHTYYTGITQDILAVRDSAYYLQQRRLKSVPWCRMVTTRATALLLQTHIRRLNRDLKEYIIYNELDTERILALSRQLPR